MAGVEEETVRAIPLRAKGGEIIAFALVDPDVFERVGHLRWCIGSGGYAMRTAPGKGQVFLHRLVLGLESGDPYFGDHVNRNRLDNRRENLRPVMPSQSPQNYTPSPKGTSKHRGVAWHKGTGKWQARVGLGRHKYYLGVFDSEEEAARVAAEFRRWHMPFSEEARAREAAA